LKSDTTAEDTARIGALVIQFYRELSVMKKAMLDSYLPAELKELLKKQEAS